MKSKGLTKMEKQAITDIANDLLKRYGYDQETDPFVDASGLAAYVGFIVGESKQLQFLDDGFMYASEDRKKLIIGVNDDRTWEEKRFIVAHELAHYFLHYKNSNLKETIMHREHVKGKDEQENDADFFAACVLMPEQSFKRLYEELKGKKYSFVDIIDYLQAVYKTPRESIKRRIEELC